MISSISDNEPDIEIMSIPEFEQTYDIPFLFSTSDKIYLETSQVNSMRIYNNEKLQPHSGDSISYVRVSSGVTYYADYEYSYFTSFGLTNNSPVVSISFPYTPATDGYICINDNTDGVLTELGVYYLNGSSEPSEPDEPPIVNPDIDLESVTNKLDNIIRSLEYIMLFQIIMFCFPLICSWSKKNVKGGD